MTSPLSLPDWVPAWVQLVLLIIGALFALAFLAMPFSVFGVKSRLEALEAHLDELHGEIRAMTLRLPSSGEAYQEPAPRAPAARPPVPPRRMEPRINPYR